MHAYLYAVYAVLHVFRLLLDLLATRHLSDRQKDLEILLLRHQLRVLQRRLPNSRPPRVSHWEKGILAVLAVRFKGLTTGAGKRLDEALLLLFKPDTVLRWHSGGTQSWYDGNGPSNRRSGVVDRLSELSWNS